MKKQDAIEHFGGESRIAEILGVSRQAVNQWPEIVPEGQAYKLQVITDGKLRADPKCYRGHPA